MSLDTECGKCGTEYDTRRNGCPVCKAEKFIDDTVRQSAPTHFADDATLARIAELERENAVLRRDAERYRWLRRKLCLTGNGDGTCSMHAINLPCRIQGWPEQGTFEQFHDAAIDAAIASEKENERG